MSHNKGKLFEAAEKNYLDQADKNSIANHSEQKNVQDIKKSLLDQVKQYNEGRLPSHKDEKPGRKDRFLPYLLVRSMVGDRGSRPYNAVFWESPDIWTASGGPDTSPEIPATIGGNVKAGEPNTLYAHVWNLGNAPVGGVRVEFYWFNPSMAIDGTHANLIGLSYVDLGPKTSPDCHKLVKCSKPWIPIFENNGHECLVVRVSSVGDPIGAAEWSPYENRHVAQRNISVMQENSDAEALINSINLNRFKDANVRLIQVGKEATTMVKLLTPKLIIDPTIETHVLSEIIANKVVINPNHPQTSPQETTVTPRILPHTLITLNPKKSVSDKTTEILNANPTLHDLFLDHDKVFHDKLHDSLFAKPLNKDNARVLRVVSIKENQIVGGYTLLVTPKI